MPRRGVVVEAAPPLNGVADCQQDLQDHARRCPAGTSTDMPKVRSRYRGVRVASSLIVELTGLCDV